MAEKLNMQKVMNDYDKVHEKYAAFPVSVWAVVIGIAAIIASLKIAGILASDYWNISYLALIFGSLYWGYRFTHREGYEDGFIEGVDWDR